MKRSILTVTAIFAFVILTFWTISVLAAAARIDQQQPVIGPGGTWAIGGTSGQIVAQVFTSGINGALREVQLPIVCSPDGNLIVEIQRTTSDGLPNGDILTSETFPGSDFPASIPPVFRSLAFHVPAAPVRVGRQFAIVLRSSESCGVFKGPAGDPYIGGRSYFISAPNNPSVWVPLGPPSGDSDDLPFITAGHGGGR